MYIQTIAALIAPRRNLLNACKLFLNFHHQLLGEIYSLNDIISISICIMNYINSSFIGWEKTSIVMLKQLKQAFKGKEYNKK